MSALPVDPLTTVPALLAGAALGWLVTTEYRSLRRGTTSRDPDLVRPFLLLGLIVALAAVSLPVYVAVRSDGAVDLLFAAAISTSVPWTVFALRYVGRGHLVDSQLATILTGLTIVVSVYTTFEGGGLPSQLEIVVSLVLLLALGLLFLSSGLILISTFRHNRFSVLDGIVVASPLVVMMLATQVFSRLDASTGTLTASAFLAVAGVFTVGVTRHEMLVSRPGTNMLGERAAIRQLGEAILVVDSTGSVLQSNDEAEKLFGPEITDRSLGGLLDATVSELRACDTVEQWTERGYRRLDPRVEAVTSSQGEELGYTITLIDVTDREIRRQRIQVLNRILRHNMRNDISAIKARADLATDPDRDTETQVKKVVDVADDLARLGAEARRIEKLMRRSRAQTGTVDIAEVVEEIAHSEADGSGATVRTDVPSVSLGLDRGLLAYAVRNLIENAIEHNDVSDPQVEIRGTTTDQGVSIVVADNGPGIPESERAVIDAGMEDDHRHATSVGLWGTNWAVQTMGGKLTFDESDLGGAAVSISLPVEDTDIQ